MRDFVFAGGYFCYFSIFVCKLLIFNELRDLILRFLLATLATLGYFSVVSFYYIIDFVEVTGFYVHFSFPVLSLFSMSYGQNNGYILTFPQGGCKFQVCGYPFLD